MRRVDAPEAGWDLMNPSDGKAGLPTPAPAQGDLGRGWTREEEGSPGLVFAQALQGRKARMEADAERMKNFMPCAHREPAVALLTVEERPSVPSVQRQRCVTVLKNMPNLHTFLSLDTAMGLRQDNLPSFTAPVGSQSADLLSQQALVQTQGRRQR